MYHHNREMYWIPAVLLKLTTSKILYKGYFSHKIFILCERHIMLETLFECTVRLKLISFCLLLHMTIYYSNPFGRVGKAVVGNGG